MKDQVEEAEAIVARDQGLTVEIVDGRLVISIGVDALMVAAKGSPAFEEDENGEPEWTITSVNGFADDILTALTDEEEDGTTLVHIAIDAAIERALEAGSLNVSYGDDE